MVNDGGWGPWAHAGRLRRPPIPRVAPLDSGGPWPRPRIHPSLRYARSSSASRSSASGGPRCWTARARTPSASSTRRASSPRASASSCSLDHDSFPETDPLRRPPLPRLRDGAQPPGGRRRHHGVRHDRRAAGCSWPRRTSRSSAARSARCTRRRSARSRTSRCRPARRSSRSTTRADARIQEGAASLAGYGYVVRAQRACLGRDPADQRDHGPVRRRRRLLPRDHRLHLHGARDLAHVHHRDPM